MTKYQIELTEDSYSIEPNFEKFYNKPITIQLEDSEKQGILIQREYPFFYDTALIYYYSEKCIGELLLNKKTLNYVNKETLKSEKAYSNLHYKDTTMDRSSKFSKFEKILNSHKD